MLAPRDTPTRQRKSLNGLWRFVTDPEESGGTRSGGKGCHLGRGRCRCLQL